MSGRGGSLLGGDLSCTEWLGSSGQDTRSARGQPRPGAQATPRPPPATVTQPPPTPEGGATPEEPINTTPRLQLTCKRKLLAEAGEGTSLPSMDRRSRPCAQPRPAPPSPDHQGPWRGLQTQAPLAFPESSRH
ncbi:homeobox protein Hox-B4-like [Cervus elaphus]|uniref:homeobox protein Hox-B4-like n=1 Tax=Cervus canadensis TaxID=1574408 RepID=UPI001C9E35F1|nr:homeobox protein Hox-B4-like [Cervus canadensis]XP_043782091.1 homeobox protein Hox-B4-like [Cervus elaphus]